MFETDNAVDTEGDAPAVEPIGEHSAFDTLTNSNLPNSQLSRCDDRENDHKMVPKAQYEKAITKASPVRQRRSSSSSPRRNTLAGTQRRSLEEISSICCDQIRDSDSINADAHNLGDVRTNGSGQMSERRSWKSGTYTDLGTGDRSNLYQNNIDTLAVNGNNERTFAGDNNDVTLCSASTDVLATQSDLNSKLVSYRSADTGDLLTLQRGVGTLRSDPVQWSTSSLFRPVNVKTSNPVVDQFSRPETDDDDNDESDVRDHLMSELVNNNVVTSRRIRDDISDSDLIDYSDDGGESLVESIDLLISGGDGNSLKNIKLFISLFHYDPATMSPNPDAASVELPFREGQIIKVGRIFIDLTIFFIYDDPIQQCVINNH